jgi:glycosyltransferase involved in cell wall biosynthesis
MRIVAHNGARIWGGAERATVALLKGLHDRGHDVLLLCNDQSVASQSAARGVPAEVCAIGGDIAMPHAFRLSRVLKRHKPDVFIVGTFKKLFLAALGAKMAGVPRVIARVGLESDTPRSIKYRVALKRWTDGVVVNANRMAEPFKGKSVRVIWNAVDSRHMTPDATKLRHELDIPADAFVIGTVARLALQKRIDRLLEVSGLLPDVLCIIAGEGTRREELTKKMSELGVSERVRFLGHRNDVGDVLAALDVFVVTSDTEGLSNAMLEAMSYGLPVVSTDVSGAEDALGEDSEGQRAGIVTDFDPRSIAEGISTLKNDPELRGAMGLRARRRAMNQFSIDKMLSEWEEFLSAGTVA